jgi:hypothetical protein
VNGSIQELLDDFNRLSEAEQRLAASEILKRAAEFESPPLTDEQLTLAAEDIFLELDEREAADARS